MSWVFDGDWEGRDAIDLPYIWADIFNAMAERSIAIGVKPTAPVIPGLTIGSKTSGFTADDFIGAVLFSTTTMAVIYTKLNQLFGGGNGVVSVTKFCGWLREDSDGIDEDENYYTALISMVDEAGIDYTDHEGQPTTAMGPFDGIFYAAVRACLDRMLYPVYGATAVYFYGTSLAYPGYTPIGYGYVAGSNGNGSKPVTNTGAKAYADRELVTVNTPVDSPGTFLSVTRSASWSGTGPRDDITWQMYALLRQYKVTKFRISIEGPYADMPILGDVIRMRGGVSFTYSYSSPIITSFGGAVFSSPGGIENERHPPALYSYNSKETEMHDISFPVNEAQEMDVVALSDGWPFYGTTHDTLLVGHDDPVLVEDDLPDLGFALSEIIFKSRRTDGSGFGAGPFSGTSFIVERKRVTKAAFDIREYVTLRST